jgi:NAD(P)-dependent dehydrogenase (short-subunit alcohol dehydrogenase family)
MTERPLGGKSALVTGGGTGIGLAISRELAALGARVAVHQRTAEKAAAGVQALRCDGAEAAEVVADLRSADGCTSAIQQAKAAVGPLDILVNNAAVTGLAAINPIAELDEELMDQTIAVNLAAVIRCSHLAVQDMPARGVIVNVGSVAGYAAQHGAGVYVATKSALIGLTRSLALELAGRGIRAVHIAPGDVETETSRAPRFTADRRSSEYRRKTPLGRRGTPEEIAAVVGFVCTPDAGFITGSSIVVDGGFLTY